MENPDYLKIKLSEILEAKPVFQVPDYVVSYTMQERSRLRARNEIEDRLTWLSSNISLPSCIKFSNRLGIYEKKLLSKLILNKKYFIAYRGGSRSGKSSIFRFLKSICERNFESCKKTCEDLSCVHFLIADVVTHSDHFSLRANEFNDEDSHVDQDLLNEFFYSLSDLIFTSFKEEYLKIEVIETKDEIKIYDFFLEAIEFMKNKETPFGNLSSQVHSKLDLHNWSAAKSMNAKGDLLESALRKINLNADKDSIFVLNKLKCVLIPIMYYAYKNSKRTFVLVIDNIDHLTLSTQNTMVDEFRNMFDRSNLHPINKFKILMPVRLATYARMHGVAADLEVIDHESVKVSDLIFYKLNSILFQSALKQGINDLDNLATYLTLISHITDSKGYICNMLDAIAGTNIANGYETVKEWILDREIQSKSRLTAIDVEDREILTHLATSILERLWDTCIQSIIVSFENIDREIAYSDERVIELVKLSSNYFINIIRDHGLISSFSGSKSYGKSHFFNFFESELRKEAKTILAQNIKNIESLGHRSPLLKIKTKAINSAIINQLLKNKINTEAIFQKIVVLFQQHFLSSFEENCLSKHSEHKIKIDQEMLKTLHKWLNLIISNLSIFGYSIESYDSKRSMVDVTITPFYKSIMRAGPKVSRFVAGRKLLQPGNKHHKDTVNIDVVNLLIDDQGLLNPILLNILYKIYYNNDNYQINMGELKGYLNYTRQIPSDDVNKLSGFLKRITTLSNRLVFADAYNYNFRMDKLVKDSTVQLSLSASGKRYIEDLIITPPYLQWAFLKNQEGNIDIDNNNFIEQLEAYYENWQVVCKKEFNNISGLIKNGGNNESTAIYHVLPSVKLPVFDIFIRSFKHYIPAINAHYRKLKKKNEHDKQLKRLDNFLESFFDAAYTNISSLKSMFDYTNVEWENIYAHAAYDLEKYINPNLNIRC